MKQIPDDIAYEVLTMLPAKSLVRFRSVCKLWNSLIVSPNFVKSHQTRSQAAPPAEGTCCLLISFNEHEEENHGARSLFFTDRLGNCVLPTISLTVESPRAIQVLNGLMCFKKHDCIRVCNLSTREVFSLPRSRLSPNYRLEMEIFLGFSPSSQEYKILTLWLKIATVAPTLPWEHCKSVECEIFTLGTDSTLRNIDPPPYKFYRLFLKNYNSICVNGVMYWINALERHDLMLTFDVGDEKFGAVVCPKLVIPGTYYKLIEVEGCLGLVVKNFYCSEGVIEIGIHVLVDHRDQKWCTKDIRCQFGILKELGHGCSGKVFCADGWTLAFVPKIQQVGTLMVLCYDLKNGNCSVVEDVELPASWPNVLAVTKHVENILPLNGPPV